jgi:hypothetical protein
MAETLCACGCGEAVGVSRHNRPQYGHVAGQLYRFIVGHYRRLYPKKDYPVQRNPTGRGVKAVHLVRAEKALGRPLPLGAEVHHADLTKSPNAPLVICPHVGYHKLLHIHTRVLRAGGVPHRDWYCLVCHAVKPKERFTKDKGYCGYRSRCKDCVNQYQREQAALRRCR